MSERTLSRRDAGRDEGRDERGGRVAIDRGGEIRAARFIVIFVPIKRQSSLRREISSPRE